jgi:F420-dependent oxidoreductase-like protein
MRPGEDVDGMRFAIKTRPEHQTWEEIRDAWIAADEIPLFESAWNWDHFYPLTPDYAGPNFEAWTMLAAMAQATRRIRIGCQVTGLIYRHPAVLANMAATVDHITDGRFTLGVGAGWQVNEHEQYGIDLPAVTPRLDRFVEALQVLQGLLRQPRTTFAGEYYRLTDAVCEPKPVQDPLPILIGGAGERRMLRIVARYADAWNAWGQPDLIAHKSALLDDYCAEIGRDPRAVRRTAQSLVVVDGPLPEGLASPVIGGSPARLAETVAQYREIGLDELIVPDALLGRGAQRLSAMDRILELARG